MQTLCAGLACDNTGTDNELCCNDRAVCTTISCAAGTVADSTAASTLCVGAACVNTGTDNALCCNDRAVCSTILCAAGTVADASASPSLCAGEACDSTDADNALCCNDRAVCSSMSCTAITVADVAATQMLCVGEACDNTGADNGLCCNDRAACSTISCDAGWAAESPAAQSLCAGQTCDNTGADNDMCCEIPDIDCVGSWSVCTAAYEGATERQLTETTAQSGNGASCRAASSCEPGEGDCAGGGQHVDCAGSWSACTSACEEGAARTWSETAAQAGQGAACPAAAACQPGHDACPQDTDCAGSWSPCTSACEVASARVWSEATAQSGQGAACVSATTCQAGEDQCPAVCSTITCAAGTVVDSTAVQAQCTTAVCDSSGADNDLCCNDRAACSSISCAGGTVADVTAASTLCVGDTCDNTSTDNALCCNDRAVCSTISCAAGTITDSAAAQSSCAGSTCDAGVDNDLCCNGRATCSGISCIAGTVADATTASTLCVGEACDSSSTDNDVCCNDRARCSTLSCDDGTVAEITAAQLLCAGSTCDTGVDNDLCCIERAVCSSMTCVDGTVAEAIAAQDLCAGATCDNAGADNDLCCNDREACSSISCAGGTSTDLAAAQTLCAGTICDNTGADNTLCCNDRAACSSITCPADTLTDTNAAEALCAGDSCATDSGDSDDGALCCNDRAACSTIACVTGTVANVSATELLCIGESCDSTGNDNDICCEVPDIDCVGSWGSFESCSVMCGGGSQSRMYNVSKPQSGNGADCVAAHIANETQLCNTDVCPVNCVGSWGGFGECSATCEGGTQSRTYNVTSPQAGAGAACDVSHGANTSQACNTGACPIDCIGAWGSWGSCDVACEGGRQSRSYSVSTAAANGGARCETLDGVSELETCNSNACSGVNCSGTWAACTSDCEAASDRVWFQSTAPVSDGLACSQPTACSPGDGRCLGPGCDGVVGSGAVVDDCGVCGGDHVCRQAVQLAPVQFTGTPDVTDIAASVASTLGLEASDVEIEIVSITQEVQQVMTLPGTLSTFNTAARAQLKTGLVLYLNDQLGDGTISADGVVINSVRLQGSRRRQLQSGGVAVDYTVTSSRYIEQAFTQPDFATELVAAINDEGSSLSIDVTEVTVTAPVVQTEVVFNVLVPVAEAASVQTMQSSGALTRDLEVLGNPSSVPDSPTGSGGGTTPTAATDQMVSNGATLAKAETDSMLMLLIMAVAGGVAFVASLCCGACVLSTCRANRAMPKAQNTKDYYSGRLREFDKAADAMEAGRPLHAQRRQQQRSGRSSSSSSSDARRARLKLAQINYDLGYMAGPACTTKTVVHAAAKLKLKRPTGAPVREVRRGMRRAPASGRPPPTSRDLERQRAARSGAGGRAGSRTQY